MTANVPDYVLACLIIIIAFPVLSGILAVWLKRKTHMLAIVAMNTVVLIGASLVLFWYMKANETATLFFGSEWFGIDIHEILIITDLLLLVVFLVIGAAIKNYAVIGLGLLQILPLAYFDFTYPNASEDVLEISFQLDYLALIFILICSIIGSLIAIYAVEYMRKDKRMGPFFFFVLAFLGAMNGAVLSNNIIYLYFFWEVTTICCYFLIRHDKTEIAQKNAEWALVVTMAGGAALLAGVFMFANYQHTMAISEVLKGNEELLALPVFLFALAAFTKSAQIPFESWLTGAMVAPTPVSALLHSSTMVKLGVYLILRMEPLIGHFQYLALFIGFVGAFTFAATAALAIQEVHMKKVLAYSTIGNLGLIIALTAMGTPESIAAALILTIFHAISKALLFLSTGIIQHEFHTKEIEGSVAMLTRSPTLATMMILGMMTMFLIPFGVFIGKYIALGSSTINPLFVFLIAVGSIASEVFYVKWIGRMISPTGGKKDKKELSALYLGPVGTLLAGAIVLTAFLPMLIEALVDPVQMTMGTEFVMDYFVFSPAAWGWVPVSLGLMVLLIIVIYNYMEREGKPTTPYACGIPQYEGEQRAEYFSTQFSQKWVNLAMDVIAIHILILTLVAAAWGAGLIPEVV